MYLSELSHEYRAHAAVLRTRIQELKAARPESEEPEELDWRIRTLSAMYRETRDLGVLCEHYYERGYYRNAKYTI